MKGTNQSVDELVDALAAISPMPEDDSPDMTIERLREYEELLMKIEALVDQSPNETDPRLIDALIGSFGYGHGFELYWTVINILWKFPQEQFLPRLRRALQYGHSGPRKWTAYMLGCERNSEYVPLLVTTLSDPKSQVREQALVALSMIGDISALDAMKPLLEDPVEDVRKTAAESIRDLESRESK